MATESIRVSGIIPATPERIYQAWLNGREHGAMTGGVARVEPTIGGSFTAWDGYIAGRTIELELDRRIVQTWRTTEFPADAPDSRLELILEPTHEGTRLTFEHSEIPQGQGQRYESGWKAYYLEPMVRYFEAASRPTRPMDLSALLAKKGEARKPPAKKPPAKKPPAKKPPAKKPTAKKPPAKKPPARKPPAKKPTTQRPAAKKPAAKKPAAKRPAAKRSKAGGKTPRKGSAASRKAPRKKNRK